MKTLNATVSMISHNEIFHANESQQYDNNSTVKYAVQKSFARDFYNHNQCLCIQLFVHHVLNFSQQVAKDEYCFAK